jgi:hypothetical protein
MRSVRVGLGMAVLAVLFAGASAHADDPVTTSCKVTKTTINGTGPYTIMAEGSISLSATEKGFLGVQYYVLELADGGQTYYGFTNRPDGPPIPGMAAKKVTGSSPPFPRKGDYRVVFTMQYLDKDGAPKTISGTTDVTVK